MLNNKLISIINKANINRYADGKIVENYIAEKYHQKRIEIALKMFIRRVKNTFPSFPNEEIKIIDIGCGNSTVPKIFYELGFSVIASDYSIEQISFQCNDRLSIQKFDANDKFPFPQNSFHAIYSGELLEHLFDTSHFLEECKRILKPNGILIVTTPNLAGFDDRIKFLFGVSPRHVNPLHPYLKLHIRQFTSRSLSKILSEKGFHKIKIKSNYLKIYFSERKKILIRFLSILFPSIGGSLICISQKRPYENATQ